MKDISKSIRDLLSRTERTRLQNTLMRIPDKVCAVTLAGVAREIASLVYALVGEAKAERIREEIRLESRRRTSAQVRARLAGSFFSYFEQGRAAGTRVYVRPARPKENRKR